MKHVVMIGYCSMWKLRCGVVWILTSQSELSTTSSQIRHVWLGLNQARRRLPSRSRKLKLKLKLKLELPRRSRKLKLKLKTEVSMKMASP